MKRKSYKMCSVGALFLLLALPLGAIIAICAVAAVAVGAAIALIVRFCKQARAEAAPAAAEEKPAAAEEKPREEPAKQPEKEPEKEPEQPAKEPEPVPEEEPVQEVVAEEKEPEPEPVQEEEPEQEPEPVPEEEPKEEPAPVAEEGSETDRLENITEEEGTDGTVLRGYDARRRRFVVVRFDKSFTARLIQADDTTKSYYSQIKNEILSYGAKSRMSWKRETFRMGRKTVARMRMRGKTLCLYLALDAAAYDGTKYKVEDVSDVSSNEGAPCLYRIKNDRRAKYSSDLIADAMKGIGAEKKDRAAEDYAAELPYETLQALLARGLVKEIGVSEVGEPVPAPEEEPAQVAAEIAPAAEEEPAEEPEEEPVSEEEPKEEPVHAVVHEVKAAEAHTMMADEEAQASVEEGTRLADKTKAAIVNIDTLSEYFADGETIDLKEMKKRIPFLNKKVTYVKVLARGTLNKKFVVEADDFSLDAVKMIVLMGGKAIRSRRA